MRIAYLYDCAYPFVKGGGERRIYEIAKRLGERHEVDWITLKWWGDCKGDDNSGNKKENNKGSYSKYHWKNNPRIDGISYLNAGEWKEIYKNGRRSIMEAIYFAFKSFPKLLKDYDIVDCTAFPYFPAITSKIASIYKKFRLFITWHEVWGDYWYEYLGWKGFFGKFVEKIVLKLNAEHIAVSNSTAKLLEENGVKAEIVPNGVDLDYIKSIKPVGRYDLIFAGRLIKEKGVDVFIKLCDELSRNFSFKAGIIGSGPLLKWVKREVGKRDFIELMTDVEEEEYYSLIKGAKIFVLPSKREGFGIAMLESIACGTPVITIEHPMNFSSEIAMMYGYVAKRFEDMFDFAKKLLEEKVELEKPDLRDYDWNNIAKRIEKIYLEKVGENG